MLFWVHSKLHVLDRGLAIADEVAGQRRSGLVYRDRCAGVPVVCADSAAHNVVPFAATEAGTGAGLNDSLASEFHSAIAGSSGQSCA